MPKPKINDNYIITDELCSYGCNKLANFSFMNGKFCCANSSNKCEAMKIRNKAGLKLAHKQGAFQNRNIDYTVIGKKVAATRLRKLLSTNWEDLGPTSKAKIVLIEQNNKCLRCGISSWQGKKISFELDHIDGNNRNYNRNNLRYLCPNCHSQTDTFRGRNMVRLKVSDEELLLALESESSIRAALLKVGMAAKGANYNRVKKLLGGIGK